jgi:hypothetical protein
MNLHILFGHRKESYEGEYTPEPLLCWSEFEVDDNPEGFDADVLKTLKERGTDFEVTRLILIRVNGDAITRILRQPPVLAGEVVPDP